MSGTANVKRERPLLAVAIERENWDLAALCIAAGVAKAVAKLPPETIEALLALLDEDARGR